MSMLPFRNPILLRGVWTCYSVVDAVFGKILLEEVRGVFSSPISLKLLDFTG